MAIEWQPVLITAFVALGGSVAIPAAAAWLLKTALTEWLARETDAFKTRLQADANTEIERLKNSLEMIATEHQVRFSKLHEKRAEVIDELYKKLTDVFWHGQLFVMTSEGNPTRYQKEEFAKMQNEVQEAFYFAEKHRIYLPESLCTLLDRYIGQLRGTVLAAGIFGRIENPSGHVMMQSFEAFTKAYEKFETEIPAARRSLETEFRKMLGVEPS